MLNAFKSFFRPNPKDNTTPITILVVEDSETDRLFVTRTLEKAGFRVETAVNGALGLEKAKALKPDLILLDCEMPVMGGVEMCKKLKETNGIHNTLVIFLTGLDTPKNTIDCFEADAEHYLSKPISARLLTAEIKKVLEEKSLLK